MVVVVVVVNVHRFSIERSLLISGNEHVGDLGIEYVGQLDSVLPLEHVCDEAGIVNHFDNFFAAENLFQSVFEALVAQRENVEEINQGRRGNNNLDGCWKGKEGESRAGGEKQTKGWRTKERMRGRCRRGS